MIFSKTSELDSFIRKNNIFSGYIGLSEITKGGTSYNFCIKTENGKYFLKLLFYDDAFQKIRELYRSLGILYETAVETFDEYKILIMPYWVGRKLRFRDCNAAFFQKMSELYKMVQNCRLDERFIAPMQDIQRLRSEVGQKFQNQKDMLGRFMYRKIWKPLQAGFCYLPAVNTVIHGDFTSNNIMVSAKGELHILDWENLRHGYMAEDFAYITLELAGFRGLYGSRSRLKTLCTGFSEKMHISRQEWLYGMQMFYLNLLARRFNNKAKQSWRKRLCLYICLLSYFRAQKTIKEII